MISGNASGFSIFINFIPFTPFLAGSILNQFLFLLLAGEYCEAEFAQRLSTGTHCLRGYLGGQDSRIMV
jgi:hypothetical protein